jgi:GMP synthase-like glutamine amidotransferase
MKIALLEADHTNEDLRAVHGDLPDIYRSFFAGGGECSLDAFDLTRGERPPADHACDAFVLTGSRHAATGDEPWMDWLRSFIREGVRRGARFVGFCFGHQVLAHALGGRVARSERGWNVGVRPLAIRRWADWMRPRVGAMHLVFNHRDQVVEAPPGAVVLAGDELCPVQMFSLGDRILGLQAHPEYSIQYQEALMRVASGLPRDALEDARRRNRAHEPDGLTMLRWIQQFIGR